jgi:hypothetical protein
MERDSRSGWQGKGSLEELLRERIRGTIELILEQELRSERRARNGSGIDALGTGTAIAAEH